MTTLIEAPIAGKMRTSFLDYSMSVIMSRALPDVRDGLKPVHRRVLYAMHEAGNLHGKPFRKSARTVGDVIGKYHPHGDVSVYDAAARQTQPFTMRVLLIDGQGNFGSIDGDRPAAMRYTEMRLSRVASEFFQDIDKETVAWQPNYDGEETEPSVLPSPFPNLLVNGTEGIAVGMACMVPPHNLREVIAATLLLMADPEAPTADVMAAMPGPDFPTGAIVHDLDGYADAIETGRGRVQIRSVWHEEERGRGLSAIVIDELPYQVNKAELEAHIAQLVRDKLVEGIADIRDESSKEGIRLWIALRKDESAEAIFAELASKTNLEVAKTYNVTVLDQGRPRLIGLRQAILRWVAFRREVVHARHVFERKKALRRLHLLDAYLAALGAIDAVIGLIRRAASAEDARAGLEALLSIDGDQAQAVLDMRLQRLAAMEIQSVRDEHAAVAREVDRLTAVIEDPALVDGVIRDELASIESRFGDARRTEISHGITSLTREDLIPREDVLITMTKDGYVKRGRTNDVRSQGRGTRGKSSIALGDDDAVSFIQQSHSHGTLMAFTSTGQAYAIKAHRIPEAPPGGKGRHVRNVIEGLSEDIAAVLAVPESDPETTVMTVTKSGQVKRTCIEDYAGATKRAGLRGVSLDEGDALVGAFAVRDGDHVMLMSDSGNAVRFRADDARVMGRATGGVRGMRLDEGESVIGAAVVKGGDDPSMFLLCIGAKGVGKRTAVAEFPTHGRGGGGVVAFKATGKSGTLIAAMGVTEAQDVVMLASNGVGNRIAVRDIRETGRTAAGVILISLDEGQSLVGATTVASEPPAAATTETSAGKNDKA